MCKLKGIKQWLKGVHTIISYIPVALNGGWRDSSAGGELALNTDNPRWITSIPNGPQAPSGLIPKFHLCGPPKLSQLN